MTKLKIAVENLICGYDEPILNNVSFILSNDKITGIIGQNGSGKSTLGMVLAGLHRNHRGNIYFNNQLFKHRQAEKEMRKRISIVFQNPENQLLFPGVRDDFGFILQNFRVPRAEWQNRIDRALSSVNMRDFAEQNPFQLSGGQKQRLVIAMALLKQPDFIIFDEATSMLDFESRQTIYQIIEQLKQQHIGVVWITNNLDELLYLDDLLLIKNKHVHQYPKSKILASPHLLTEAGLGLPLSIKLSQLLLKKNHQIATYDDLIRQMEQL